MIDIYAMRRTEIEHGQLQVPAEERPKCLKKGVNVLIHPVPLECPLALTETMDCNSSMTELNRLANVLARR